MDRLLEIFEKEISLYKKILELSKNKTGLLKANDVKAIEASNKEEEALVAEVIEEEKVRIKEIKEICKSHNMPEKTLKIEELCEFEEAPKEELMNFKNEILDILKELKKVNQLNSVLVKSSLEYVNFAMNMLTDSTSNPTYQAHGRQENKAQRNLFDIKL